jgi:transposase-like protein
MYEIVLCPDCQLPAKLVSVVPGLEPHVDQVKYHCASCDKEFERSVKSKSLDGLK